MSVHISARAGEVSPFLAMELMECAKKLEAQGRDVIYLSLGEPDFPTPKAISDCAIRAINDGATTYTHSLGLLELRQEITSFYQRRYGVSISPEQIVISSGTSPLMLLMFALLLDDGDEIILADPSYACYPNFIRFAGGRPVFLRTRQEDGFQPRPEEVEKLITPRTRGILINSPANPAGSILPTPWLEQLGKLPVPLLSDEIYHGLTYEGEERCALEFTDQAFILGGFSKAYAMTGWRLGYLIAPRECVRPLQNLHQNFLLCANNFVQRAGIVALRDCGADVERMRTAYDERRRHIVERLRRLGLGVEKAPVGAFYVLADARHVSGDSRALALEILEETGVAVTPGIDFGAGAEGFLRFSYANSLANIDKALDRLEGFLRKRGRLPQA